MGGVLSQLRGESGEQHAEQHRVRGGERRGKLQARDGGAADQPGPPVPAALMLLDFFRAGALAETAPGESARGAGRALAASRAGSFAPRTRR